MNFNFTKNDTNKNEKTAEGDDNSRFFFNYKKKLVFKVNKRPKFDSEEEVSMDDETNEPHHEEKRESTEEKHSGGSKQEESQKEHHETVRINSFS